MSDEKVGRLHELQFRIALETRNFEISMFWQRSNYFLALSTAIAAGYFALNDPRHEILLAGLGVVVAWLWLLVNLGGKFWQARWEHRLGQVELGLHPDLRLFTVPTAQARAAVRNAFENGDHGRVRRVFDWAILKKPSVSHAMVILSIVFLLFWIVLLVQAIWCPTDPAVTKSSELSAAPPVVCPEFRGGRQLDSSAIIVGERRDGTQGLPGGVAEALATAAGHLIR